MGNYDVFAEIVVEIKGETDMAFLVSDGDTQVWIPKSQIENPEDCILGKTSTIEIPEWLALEKELI